MQVHFYQWYVVRCPTCLRFELILFYLRGIHMLQDVAERRVPKRGHCDLGINCQMKVII